MGRELLLSPPLLACIPFYVFFLVNGFENLIFMDLFPAPKSLSLYAVVFFYDT